jgi:4-hydroxybenzoyl-CoA thioesterase
LAKAGDIFAVKRIVSWGDCDPAGIIYTPRAFDFATEALEAFWRDVIGVNWMDLNWVRHMGAPTVRAECDFIKALKPDMAIEIEVRVLKLGSASLTFGLTCRDVAGDAYFKATYVACTIARPDFKATPIPPDMRARIEAYRAVCGDN